MKTRKFSVMLAIPALLLALALAAPAFAAMTSDEKEEKYRAAVLELETYLESYGMNGASLEGIEGVFGSLGGYSQSRCLYYYTQVLEKLAADDYGYGLDSLLLLLEGNERFEEYLSGTMKDSAIMPVRFLTDYAAGRKKEYEGDTEGAMAEYAKCKGFFDADDRFLGLRDGMSAEAYNEAILLLEGEDLAGAYYAFDRAKGYEDSEERKKGIEKILGYIPANETDNPGAVTGLRVTGQDADRITLSWDSAAHAGGYEVAYCRSGTQNWILSETTGKTSATVAGLAMDTVYDFRVTAVAERVRTETVLTGVRTVIPTPKPTASPSPTQLVLQQVTDLCVTATKETSVTLSWNGVKNAEQYKVTYRKSRFGSWRTFGYVNETKAEVTGLQPDMAYDFQITAVSGSTSGQGKTLSGVKTAETAYGRLISGNFEYLLLRDGTAVITGYIGEAKMLSIPARIDGHPVTGIRDSSFYERTDLSAVTIPEGVTYIGNSAFYSCVNLTAVTIPEGVKFIGDTAFQFCASLTSVTIPDSVTDLGYNPWADCDNLTTIIVSPDHPTLTVIDGALYSKTDKRLICVPGKLKGQFDIPEGILIIDVCAAKGCKGLTSVTIPDSVTAIPYYAFADCDSLISITIPAGVTNIDLWAFRGTYNLTFTVAKDSYAEKFCVDKGLSCRYADH